MHSDEPKASFRISLENYDQKELYLGMKKTSKMSVKLYKAYGALPSLNFFTTHNVGCFLFPVIFFLQSCSTPPAKQIPKPATAELNNIVTKEERQWMEKFFKELFLESSAIYTLFGTKPLSAQTIILISAEEYQRGIAALLDREGITGKERETMLTEISREHLEYDFHKNWEKWTAFIAQHPSSPFLFAKHPTLSNKIWSAHILNVQQTIWTLQKHYDIFRQELGFDFDPVAVTMDFKNVDCTFWKQVFENHLLSGIVYGYGYKNSYFFNLYSKIPQASSDPPPFFSSLTRKGEADNRSLTVENITLPSFHSFGLPFNKDPLLEKYKLERVEIKKNLNESNFFEKTLLQLIGKNGNDYAAEHNIARIPVQPTTED